jgi:hypothetical protein
MNKPIKKYKIYPPVLTSSLANAFQVKNPMTGIKMKSGTVKWTFDSSSNNSLLNILTESCELET